MSRLAVPRRFPAPCDARTGTWCGRCGVPFCTGRNSTDFALDSWTGLPAWSKKAQNNVRIGVWACRCVLGFPQQEKHETFAICDLDLLTVFAAELAVETGAARCCLVPATQVAVRVAVCRLVQLERP
jgi:hypothetical protein